MHLDSLCVTTFVVMLTILGVVEQTQNVPLRNTCCHPDHLLSEDQKCVALGAAEKEVKDLNHNNVSKDPFFKCSNGSKLLNFTSATVLNGSIIEPLFNQTIQDGDFCIQPSTATGYYSVLFCRPLVQIKKCCPFGQFINRTSVKTCINNIPDTSAKLPLAGIVAPGYDEEWIQVQENVSLHCEFDYNIYLPNYYSDHRFTVTNERGLYIRKAAYAPIRQSKDYCIDSTIYKNGTEGVSSEVLNQT